MEKDIMSLAVNPLDIIAAYYAPGSEIHAMLVAHSRHVAEKALDTARRLTAARPDISLDMPFIEEAALLHDIGIFLTHTPSLCCHGEAPYLRHGVLGRELLEDRGLHRHALVCERHVGVGISAKDIRTHGLPLPERDMIPQTLEERIIAYADKFFSKDCVTVVRKNTPADILSGLARHGADKARIFREWMREFDEPGDDGPPIPAGAAAYEPHTAMAQESGGCS